MSSNQRSARFQVPDGACDSHCHVFGPVEQYPVAAISTYPPPLSPLDAYLKQVEPLGIDRCVFVQPSVYADDNRYLLESLTKVGMEKARGVVEIDERNFSKERLLQWEALGSKVCECRRMRKPGTRSLCAAFSGESSCKQISQGISAGSSMS